MLTLGEKIRKAREDRGLTQEELSVAISIERVTLSNYENGKVKNYPKKIIEAIALKTGKPFSFFTDEQIRDSNLKNNLDDDFLGHYQHLLKIISGLDKEKLSALITLLQ